MCDIRIYLLHLPVISTVSEVTGHMLVMGQLNVCWLLAEVGENTRNMELSNLVSCGQASE